MIKVLYKPLGLLVSVLGGLVAGAIFKRIWKLAAHEDDAPQATDADRGWRGSPDCRRAPGRDLRRGQGRG